MAERHWLRKTERPPSEKQNPATQTQREPEQPWLITMSPWEALSACGGNRTNSLEACVFQQKSSDTNYASHLPHSSQKPMTSQISAPSRWVTVKMNVSPQTVSTENKCSLHK